MQETLTSRRAREFEAMAGPKAGLESSWTNAFVGGTDERGTGCMPGVARSGDEEGRANVPMGGKDPPMSWISVGRDRKVMPARTGVHGTTSTIRMYAARRAKGTAAARVGRRRQQGEMAPKRWLWFAEGAGEERTDAGPEDGAGVICEDEGEMAAPP